MMVKSRTDLLQFFTFTRFLLSRQSIKPVRGVQPALKEIGGYDYKKGSPKGPERWGELKKEWKECKSGKLQSPIDLLDSSAKKAKSRADDLKKNYKPSKETIRRLGYGINIEWKGNAGSIRINSTGYFLKRCHWHRSSEHFVNGKRYDLEWHMVHQSKNKKVAVVGYLYQTGNRSDPLLSKITLPVSSLTGTKENCLGMTDLSSIVWPNSQFYRYMGSYTAPPCTGGVIWSVNKEVRSVSKEQVRLIEKAANGTNARPLQPLNKRAVTLFGPQ